MKKHHTASISMQKIETESGQESLGHSSIYLLLYLCDMKVKNIESDIHSVSLAQGGASKCCRTFSLFITIFVIRAVWLWDTLQAWEGYAISRHSTKSLHGALMNASIFFFTRFSLAYTGQQASEVFCPGMVYHRRHFMDRQFFDWLKLKMCDSYFHKIFFFREVWFFRPLK